jgi:hypothetical protein
MIKQNMNLNFQIKDIKFNYLSCGSTQKNKILFLVKKYGKK